MRSEKEPVSHQRENESRLPSIQSKGPSLWHAWSYTPTPGEEPHRLLWAMKGEMAADSSAALRRGESSVWKQIQNHLYDTTAATLIEFCRFPTATKTNYQVKTGGGAFRTCSRLPCLAETPERAEVWGGLLWTRWTPSAVLWFEAIGLGRL